MKKSLFEELDELVEWAVSNATDKEQTLQDYQAKKVKSAGLTKKEKEKAPDDVEEAEDEDNDEEAKVNQDDESQKKITGNEKKDDVQTPTESQPGTKTSKKLDDPSQEATENPQFGDIEKKINALRGGGSLKKPNIATTVKDYLQTLKTPEKTALLMYLTDLAQIIAPVKNAKEVKTPSEAGLETTYKPGKEPNQKADKQPEKNKSETPTNDDVKKPKSNSTIVVGK